ncbi:hypothetical protein RA280_14825 [Cupriavidus sp. CV2]|uniref:hypothetical protein n=1 Tax=Cupriavidus ulmosensis TaxID=3065913 RepID=UPI00296B09BC|nr:hypothetical protein [Cupriavidus sp. CV2]MDW3682999.1 hypothetical protein [Cupriavidus sp. CV2]
MNSLPQPLEAAGITRTRFINLCEQGGFSYELTWFWSGRNRHGRLIVRHYARSAPLVIDFARNAGGWAAADEMLDRLRTGSPRHLAVLEAVGLMERVHAEDLARSSASARAREREAEWLFCRERKYHTPPPHPLALRALKSAPHRE